MLWYNHIPISIFASGAVGAATDVNIFKRWDMLIVIVILSILPDIDVPSSLFGRLFKKLSGWINERYGHRAITHSIWAAIFVYLFFQLFNLIFRTDMDAFILSIAYFAHTVADAMTQDGVRILSPFDKSDYGLPSNQEYRFNSSHQTQLSIFGCTMFAMAFLYPWISQGFWTSYNQSYATPKTLFSEKIKSTDLLKVDWKILEGSNVLTGSGFLVDAENEDQFTLLSGDSLIHFDTHKQIIKETKFVHTGKKYRIDRETFININCDSLNSIVTNRIIINADISSLETFQMSDNGILSRKNMARLRFPNRLQFKTLDSIPYRDSLFNLTDFESKRIQNELERLDNEFKMKLGEYNRKSDSLKLYDQLAREEREEIRKEKLMRRRDEIRVPDYPVRNFAEEKYLQNALVIAQQRFRTEVEKRDFEKNQTFNNKIRGIQKTLFTCVIESVKIE
jgi:inner membrane protein